MEIKLSPGERIKILFEKISKIENEHNDSTRRLDKEDLIVIVMSTETTARAPEIVAEIRLTGNGATIVNLKSLRT